MAAGVEERLVEIPLARVRVLERAGDGGTVVLVHGITSSARTWEPFISGLDSGLRAVAPDMLGNGYAALRGARRPITADDQARQLTELADELGIEQFAGVGHSMGCAPLLRVAWQKPERVRALLLCAPTALGRPKLDASMRAARFGPTRRLMEVMAPRIVAMQARRRLQRFAGQRKVDEGMLEREAGHAIARPREQVRGFIDLIGHGDPGLPATDIDRYRRIACPVWILRGSEDYDWMPEDRESGFRDLIPAVRIIRWEGIGHAPHIQAPDRFAALLADFISATG